MSNLKEHTSSLIIIGSGPAGSVFYEKMVNSRFFKDSNICFFDKDGKLCSSQNEHNQYVENSKSICPPRLKFLVDGTKSGPDIQKYFNERIINNSIPPEIKKNRITKIERNGHGGFNLYTDNELVHVADKVVLATGLRRKLLPDRVFDQKSESYDYTFKNLADFQKIDFRTSEVIFIGSGDNALFKANRLAEWIKKNHVPHHPGCIKIFIKEDFDENVTALLLNAGKALSNDGNIEIKNSFWDIQKIEGDVLEKGVRSIHTTHGEYVSDFKNGAYISINTGYVPNIPELNGCTLKDLILIGDISLFTQGKVCTIYDAIQDSEDKAEELLRLERIKEIIRRRFDLKSVVSVDKFNSTSSKFISQDYHFLVKTKKQIFFLKKYHVSHEQKIKKEIEAITKLSDLINIPPIIKTTEGEYFANEDEMVFVLYEYIKSSNLKDLKEDSITFFDILCDVESNLLQFVSQDEFYNFTDHFNRFEKESSELLKIIKKDERLHSLRDVKYVEFLMQEMASIKNNISHIRIPKSLIHGDFLPQNILKDQSGKFWVVDWEKSMNYMVSIDVMRSVTFTIFDPKKKDLGLSVNKFGKWVKYCFNKIPMTELERKNAVNIYYFHLVSNIDFLKRLYIDRQNLNEKMAGEDFEICKWFKECKDNIQKILDDEVC